MYLYTLIYRARFKETKSESPIFGNRVAFANHFGKVISNCELFLAIYWHFCTIYIKFI